MPLSLAFSIRSPPGPDRGVPLILDYFPSYYGSRRILPVSRSSKSALEDGRIKGGIHPSELDRSRYAPVSFGRSVVVVVVVFEDTSRNALTFRLFNSGPMSRVQLWVESCIS